MNDREKRRLDTLEGLASGKYIVCSCCQGKGVIKTKQTKGE